MNLFWTQQKYKLFLHTPQIVLLVKWVFIFYVFYFLIFSYFERAIGLKLSFSWIVNAISLAAEHSLRTKLSSIEMIINYISYNAPEHNPKWRSFYMNPTARFPGCFFFCSDCFPSFTFYKAFKKNCPPFFSENMDDWDLKNNLEITDLGNL